MSSPSPDPWQSRIQRATRYAFIGFALIAALFLLTEHRAHLWGWLPFLILLACPFLHMFGHGGHAGHGAHDDREPLPKPDVPPTSPTANPPSSNRDVGSSHHHH